MQKLITQVALSRIGIRRFENKVNKAVSEGQWIERLEFHKGPIRTLCVALLNDRTK